MGEIRKTFEFGPGTSRPRSHMRTFAVPARARVSVAIDGMSVDPAQERVGVTVDLFRPNPAVTGADGPDGPAADDPQLTLAPSGVVRYSTQSYVSDTGCPHTWRVRVRAIDPTPAARVTGTIVMLVDPADAVPLTMSGPQNLDPHVVATRTLRPDGVGRIVGTGRFRIRAKWHADPLNPLAFNSFPEMTVALLRPDGSVAAEEKGFSQHSGKNPRVDFVHPVDAGDAAMTGNWKLRITNDSAVRVVDFDIAKGLDLNSPTFVSTFLAECL